MIGPADADRALWAAVVAQAKDDVDDEAFGSTEYRQAEAFLVSTSAYWVDARANVAAHLGIDGDDLRRAGLRWVNARRLAEGFPPLVITRDPIPKPTPKPKPKPVVRPPLPLLVATFPPPPPEPEHPRWSSSDVRPRKRWNRENNPFSPFYQRMYGPPLSRAG